MSQRLINRFIVVGCFFVGSWVFCETPLAYATKQELQQRVLKHASLESTTRNTALLKLMKRFYHKVETYEQLKKATVDLKNTLDRFCLQTHADVDFLVFLELQHHAQSNRRHTI